MIFYLIKNWKLLLDIILVVGGIIAFTLLDPFGMFSNSKLRGTANLVSSVQGIGELVTAEYYGEVIASLHETKIYSLEPDTISEKYQSCYNGLKDIIVSEMLDSDERSRFIFFKQPLIKEVEKSPLLSQLKSEYSTNSIYNHLIVFLAVNNLGGSANDYYKESDKTLSGNAERSVLQLLIENLSTFISEKESSINDLTTTELQEFIYDTPPYFNDVAAFHYQLNKEHEMSRRQRKKDIVFIGRGWVKAGFRFGRLDESNFYYDETSKLIRFYGLSPTILDKDINPWFIPERKIKGFELVDFYNNATFEEAKLVKKKCKEKLLAQAEKADILARSKANGEEALRNFFSLLLDEPELRVELIEFPFEREFQMIAADTLVTVEEALWVDSVYQRVKNDTLNLSASELLRERRVFNMFINRLKTLAFVDTEFQFNIFSLEAAKVLDHTLFVNQRDYDTFKKLRETLMLSRDHQLYTGYMNENQEFINGYTAFTKDFNQMMKLIDKKLNEADSIRKDTLTIDPERFRALNLNDTNLFFISSRIIDSDTIYELKHKSLDYQFSDLRYPVVSIPPDSFSDLKMSDTTRVDVLLEKYIEEAQFDSGDPYINAALKVELKNIKTLKRDSIVHELKVGPVRAFTDRINDLLN